MKLGVDTINHVTFPLGRNVKSEKFHVNSMIIYDFQGSCNFPNYENMKFTF